jgi:hypothetical protein
MIQTRIMKQRFTLYRRKGTYYCEDTASRPPNTATGSASIPGAATISPNSSLR